MHADALKSIVFTRAYTHTVMDVDLEVSVCERGLYRQALGRHDWQMPLHLRGMNARMQHQFELHPHANMLSTHPTTHERLVWTYIHTLNHIHVAFVQYV